MSALPLASVSYALAVQEGDRLVLYIEGETSGAGGRFDVVKSPLMIYPPQFVAYEIPGNPGINPGAPLRMETIGVFSFEGGYGQILLRSKEGDQVLHVSKAVPLDRIRKMTGAAVEAGAAAAPFKLLRADGGELPSPFVELQESSLTGFRAWQNRMPGAQHSLHVVGQLMMPTPGWTLSLKESKPGSNPSILVLDLEEKPPAGNALQLLTPATVSFEKKTSQYFTHVTILPDTTIPVETVW